MCETPSGTSRGEKSFERYVMERENREESMMNNIEHYDKRRKWITWHRKGYVIGSSILSTASSTWRDIQE